MDAEIVKPLVKVLSIAKRRVFWDEIIQPGQEWNAEIERALAAADAIVIMWCCDSAASAWVNGEIAAARKLAKPFTPIQLCAYPLGNELGRFQSIDLSKTVHHTCDCAIKEKALERESRSPAFGFPPRSAPPTTRFFGRVFALLFFMAALGYVTALGYVIYNYWRIAAVAAVVVLVLLAIIALLERRRASKQRRLAETISIIVETIRTHHQTTAG
jgi:hypothetical protein